MEWQEQVLIPIELKNKLRSKNKYLFNGEQQDADEFFFLLNDCLHKELSIELTNKRDVKRGPIQDSEIKRIFEVVIKRHISVNATKIRATIKIVH